MTATTRAWATLPALSLLFTLGTATAALAQSSSAQSEAAGATTGLGTSHRFRTVAAASEHCPGDTIVWSSGHGLTYHAAPASGMSKHGFYACKAEADTAGFHEGA
jgi:hypothetical protein